jgi:histidinol-phosphatase
MNLCAEGEDDLKPQLSRREFRSLVPAVFAALAESDAIILHYLHRAEANRKSDGSEVTLADRKAERLLRELLRVAWPDDVVMGEEYGGEVAKRGRCWLIDPIDGTASYVLGMPMFGSLLSLLIDGEPVFGCIRLPALEETTYAASGHGCWFSQQQGKARRVNVASPRKLATSKVGMTSVKERSWLKRPGAREVAALAQRVGRLRMVGDCVQYALLCRGVLDAAVDPFMKPWDIAPLVPCVLEAGGSIGDLNGETSRLIERNSMVAASCAPLRREITRAAKKSARIGR